MPCLRSPRIPFRSLVGLLLALIIGPGLAGALFAAPLFPEPRYQTGYPSLAVFQGDFNGDHRTDLAITSFRDDPFTGGEVWVYLGDGDGYLTVAARLRVGSFPFGAAALDLDRDGDDDLVVANYGSSDLSVLISRGDGTFEPERRVGVGPQPAWLCAGRLDADVDPDLLVVEQGTGFVRLLRGDGAGGLLDGGSFAAGVSPVSCALADFNGDAIPDLAVPSSGSDNVSIFRGIGDGTFGAPQPYAAGDSPESMAMADFNRDGEMDLAVGNSQSEDVSILLGRGDGTFAPQSRIPVGFAGYSLTAGDSDGDGAPDLAVATPGLFETHADPRGRLYQGHGDGTFDPSADFFMATAVSFQPIDDDPALELGIANLIIPGGLAEIGFLGEDHASPPRTPIEIPTSLWSDPYDIEAADIDGDGILDLAVVGPIEGDVPTALKTLLGKGDGHFVEVDSIALPVETPGSAMGDLNGDGRSDLVLSMNTSPFIETEFRVFLGYPEGFAPMAGPVSPGDLDDFTLADFDGDGVPDLVASYSALQAEDSGEIGVRLGHGDGTFGPEQRFPAGAYPTSLQTGDFDGDGNVDVVAGNWYASPSNPGGISYFRGNGDGTLAPALALLEQGAAPRILAGDVDGDWDLDVVASDALLVSEPDQYHVASIVLFGDGAGHFTEGEPFLVDETLGAELLEDFDADGDLDLAGQWDQLLRIHANDGSGSFNPAAHTFTGRGYGPLGPGDFDGDGRLDLATGGLLTILLNNGPFPATAPVARAQAPRRTECTSGSGTPVLLDGTASTDDGTIISYEWLLDFGQPGETLLGEGALLSVDLPLGEHHVTLRVTDDTGMSGTETILVTVADTTAPALSVAVTPNLIWPPNGTYRHVHVSARATDACGPATIALVSVTSSEPDGDAIQGAEPGTADFDMILQADKQGQTRTYTLLYQAADGSGNVSQATATVEVKKK